MRNWGEIMVRNGYDHGAERMGVRMTLPLAERGAISTLHGTSRANGN